MMCLLFLFGRFTACCLFLWSAKIDKQTTTKKNKLDTKQFNLKGDEHNNHEY